MAEQMENIPDDAIWVTQRSIEGYLESSVAEFYVPESNSYIEAYLNMVPLDYPEDKRIHLDGDDTIYGLTRWDNSPSVRQITKEDVVDSLKYALISEQALEGRPFVGDDWSVYNHSDRAASVIEDLKRELPADYNKIDNLYIGGYGFEHGSDSCTDTWRDLYYSTVSKEFTLTVERKTYSTSEFEDPHVSTYDKLLSEKEALAFITDPRFRQALDYRSRVNDIIEDLRREVESGHNDVETKESGISGKEDRNSVFVIVPAKVGRERESVRFFDVPKEDGTTKALAEVTLPHGTRIGGQDASFYKFVTSAATIDAGGRKGSSSHSVLLPDHNRTTGDPWKVTLTRDFGARDQNGVWQSDKRTITCTSAELKESCYEQYREYRERSQQRRAERTDQAPARAQAARLEKDSGGIDLDAEGHDARDVSGFTGSHAEQPARAHTAR